LFTNTAYRETIIIDDHIPTVPDSPWKVRDLNMLIGNHHELGVGVYRFTGYYQKFGNGTSQLKGKIVKLIGGITE
jgi:hypothetical protein